MSDAPSGAGNEEVRREVSPAVTYGAPLFGVLLLAIGIGGGVLGGYAIVQQELSLCGNPTIAVESPAATERRVTAQPYNPALPSFAFDELAPAERRAVGEAVARPNGQADVRGAFPHRSAFVQGALVSYRGADRYATVVSRNACLSIDPFVFPLGVVSIVLGIAGVLTPPAYRALVARVE